MNNIDILKLMIKGYEENGVGYSQIEALKEAVSLAKELEQAKVGLPEEKIKTIIIQLESNFNLL